MLFSIVSHTFYSYLDGFGSPDANAKRAKDLGIEAISITDHGSVCGHIKHMAACKKHKIKPILGCELYLPYKEASIKDKENRTLYHQVVWAKNLAGWHTLNKIVSKTNDIDNFYYRPRIHLFGPNGLESLLDGNIMSFSGHQGSILSNALFCDVENFNDEEKAKLSKAYTQYKESDVNFYKQFLKEDWLNKVSELALKIEKIFGKGNFFIELQNECSESDKRPLWIHNLIVECLREVSKKTGIMSTVSCDPHYPSPEDADDQRAMVMVNMKETESTVQTKIDSDLENDVMTFFVSDNFYIHSPEEMSKKFTEEEMNNSVKISDQVEEYSINHEPYIPVYKIPSFDDNKITESAGSIENRYMLHLCIEGAKRLKPWEDSEAIKKNLSKRDYWDRLNMELGVLFEAKLAPYFLIVQDYINAARYRPADHSFDWQKNLNDGGKTDPITVGIGRGSSAGCLVSFLLGITEVDPLVYDLLFARFYNKGRNTKDHIELPDIDTDFAVEDREWVIRYIEHKYGKENVAQLITFNKMQGRAAIKDIFRIKDIDGGFELANEICKFVPNESEIMDEIQQAKEEGEEDYNIIKWCLDNSEDFQEYYKNEDIKEVVDQAVNCEGIIRSQGKHPSAVVITPKKIEDCFPMVLDSKTKNKIAGFDMKDIEKAGAVKLDILGIAVLDKLKLAQDLVNRQHEKIRI